MVWIDSNHTVYSPCGSEVKWWVSFQWYLEQNPFVVKHLLSVNYIIIYSLLSSFFHNYRYLLKPKNIHKDYGFQGCIHGKRLYKYLFLIITIIYYIWLIWVLFTLTHNPGLSLAPESWPKANLAPFFTLHLTRVQFYNFLVNHAVRANPGPE